MARFYRLYKVLHCAGNENKVLHCAGNENQETYYKKYLEISGKIYSVMNMPREHAYRYVSKLCV